MARISQKTNEVYYDMVYKNEIEPIRRENFIHALERVKHKHKNDAKALCILLWITGARANELFRLKKEDFQYGSVWLKFTLPPSKYSNPRKVLLPLSDSLVEWVWEKCISKKPEGAYVFHSLASYRTVKSAVRVSLVKDSRGKIIKRERKYYEGQYQRLGEKFSKQFKRWFGFSPYVLRHNRFTIAAEEVKEPDTLRRMKGAKRLESVMPYLHNTQADAKKWAKHYLR